MRSLSRLLGEQENGTYARRAQRTGRALVERCHDARTGLFFDLAGPKERPVAVSTWSALAPLALPGLPSELRHRLVAEHLLDPRRYRAHTGSPSVALESRRFAPGGRSFAAGAAPPG